MIRGLTLEGKLIAAWLVSNPHRHFSGLYYLPLVFIQAEVGVSIGVCKKQLKVLESKGFLKYSESHSVVWVVNMLAYQSGLNSSGGKLSPQQVKGIEKQIQTLHDCPLITEFLNYYKTFKIKYDTPIDTKLEGYRYKEEVEVKEKEEETVLKDIAPSGPVDHAGAPQQFFYTCPYFEVDFNYRFKLAKEYPALPDDLLLKELSRMEDWITDNPKKRKFKSNGHLANPRLFIKNWLDRVKVSGDALFPGKPEPKIFDTIRDARRRRENGVK